MNSFSVTLLTTSPGGTLTLKRRYAVLTGLPSSPITVAVPKFPVGMSARTSVSATGTKADVPAQEELLTSDQANTVATRLNRTKL